MKDDFYDPPTDRQLDFYKLLGLPPQKGLTFTNISKLIDLRLDEIEKKGISVVCPHCKQETLLYYTKITLCPICKKPTFFYKGKLLTEKQAKKVDNQLLRDLLHEVVDFSEDELWKEYAKDRKDEFLYFIKDECQCAREDFSHDQECAIVGFFLKFDSSKCSERKRLEDLIFPAVMKPSEILKLLPPFSKCPVDCCDCDLDSIHLYEFNSKEKQIYQPSTSSLRANQPKYIANISGISIPKKSRSSASCKKTRSSVSRKKAPAIVNPLECPICHTDLKRQFWETRYTCTKCNTLLQLNLFGRLVPTKLRLEPCPVCHAEIEILRNVWHYTCPKCGEKLVCYRKHLESQTAIEQKRDTARQIRQEKTEAFQKNISDWIKSQVKKFKEETEKNKAIYEAKTPDEKKTYWLNYGIGCSITLFIFVMLAIIGSFCSRN